MSVDYAKTSQKRFEVPNTGLLIKVMGSLGGMGGGAETHTGKGFYITQSPPMLFLSMGGMGGNLPNPLKII